MKAIMGLVRPSGGSVRFEGREIAGLEPFRIARLGLGYVPEERRVFAGLTVRENLEVGRRRAGTSSAAPAWTEERLFALFPALAPMAGRLAGRMSGGEQQMLAIARTLMGNPHLLLLDEPSEGLAPVVVDRLAEAVGALKAAGLTILLSEQNLRFAAAVGDRAVVLETGHVRYDGPLAALLADEAARLRFLAV